MTPPRACVIGWPVAHSRSPLIHGAWLARHGIAGAYARESVRPEAFPAFARGLAARGYAGGNATIPHKEAALAVADEATPAARAVGAANTLWIEGGRLHADNTDVGGFLANLDASAPGWDAGGGRAVVLGAGGAARGIAHGLLGRGLAVVIVNRTLGRAEALARDLGRGAEAADRRDLPARLAGAALLANATSLGMAGSEPLSLDLAPLPASAVVADAVYVPLVTPLLAAARARELRVADGLGMLLHQAALAFPRWFGARPEVDAEVRGLVEADLTGERARASSEA